MWNMDFDVSFLVFFEDGVVKPSYAGYFVREKFNYKNPMLKLLWKELLFTERKVYCYDNNITKNQTFWLWFLNFKAD